MAGNKRQKSTADQVQTPQEENMPEANKALNLEHQKMLEWLKTVRFKRCLINGINEEDVWRKLEELNHLYEAALIAERAGYQALLDHYVDSSEVELKKYKQMVETMQECNDTLAERNNELERQIVMLTGHGRKESMNKAVHPAGNGEV